MSRETGIIGLGIFLVLLPFLGLPGAWRTTLLVLLGFALVGYGVFLRNQTLLRRGNRPEHGFVENREGVKKEESKETHAPKIQ